MALFEIKNLTFTYPDAEKPAIENIHLSIEPGEFVVICGKSGYGNPWQKNRADDYKNTSVYGKHCPCIYSCCLLLLHALITSFTVTASGKICLAIRFAAVV